MRGWYNEIKTKSVVSKASPMRIPHMPNYFLHNIIHDVMSFSPLEVSSVYFNMDGSYIFFHEIYVFGITNLPF